MNFYPWFRPGLLLWWTIAAAHADMVVVVSAKSPVQPMSAEQIAQIFLGKTNTFPGGMFAMPFDLPDSHPVREQFYLRIAGKTPAQMKGYWSRMIFTGKGQPPFEIPGTGDVKKLVAGNPNTIGYVDRAAVDSSLKIVYSD